MYASLTPLSLVLFLGIAQAVFLAAALLRSGADARTSHQLLAGLLIILALSAGNGFFYQSDLYQDLGGLIGIPQIFQFLVGPGLWFYVRSLTEPGLKLRRRDALHLLPSLGYLILALPFLTAGPLYKMVLMYSWLHQDRPIGEYLPQFWYELTLPLHGGIYLALAWTRMRQHERRIRDHFSTVDGMTLPWMRRVVAVFAGGLAGQVLGFGLIALGVPLGWAFVCAPLAASVAVWYLAWVSLRRGVTADPWTEKALPSAPEPTEAPEAPRAKYEKATLPEEIGHRIVRKLERTMLEDKPFLDPDLTLEGLASQLATSRNHLSQVLNGTLSMTFYEYVNRFRIKEAAERLIGPDADRHDILTIAGDCGFHSKSTFNKVFKAWYGVSPSEYKRGLRCPPLDGVEGDKGIV